MRHWMAMVKPESFRLLAGESELSDYQYSQKNIHHLFCKHCGIRPFGWGIIPDLGGKIYAINVASLDNIDIDELVSAPISYVDGRNDNWHNPPDEIRHL
jgi:hypothetical protein